MNANEIKLYNNVFEELQILHELINDFYEITEPHSKFHSNVYEEIDNQYNEVLEAMRSLLKGE